MAINSHHGHTVTTTLSKLLKLANRVGLDYSEENTGEEKSNYTFIFDFFHKDSTIFLYDWKEYSPLNLNRSYTFNIGAEDEMKSIDAKIQIERLLKSI